MMGAAGGSAMPTVAASVLASIAIVALALYLLMKFWSDSKPPQRSARGSASKSSPLPTPEVIQSQLKLLVDRHIIDTGGQGDSDAVRLAFRIDEPLPGSRLLRYSITTQEWIPVPWEYDAGKRHLIAKEPVSDASLWVLEEVGSDSSGTSGSVPLSGKKRSRLLDRFPDPEP
jgi:hypothetical protein